MRHGNTALNDPANPKLRAWEDVPLTDEGRLAVQLTANKLKIYSPKMVYSSDLGRDTESAMLVAEILGNIPYETDFALRTADLGTLSGLSEDQARERVLRWYQNPGEPAPSGESRSNFERRVWKFMEPKIELSREVAAFRPTVFVTHGRIQSYLDSYYNMKPAEEAEMAFPAGFAAIRSNLSGLDSFEIIGEKEPICADV
jgi:broad specificity phosphatase PhoE